MGRVSAGWPCFCRTTSIPTSLRTDEVELELVNGDTALILKMLALYEVADEDGTPSVAILPQANHRDRRVLGCLAPWRTQRTGVGVQGGLRTVETSKQPILTLESLCPAWATGRPFAASESRVLVTDPGRTYRPVSGTSELQSPAPSADDVVHILKLYIRSLRLFWYSNPRYQEDISKFWE